MIKKNIIIHPWLFALIPIINLFEHNQDIASIYYLPKPIIIVLISTSIIFFILNIFIKNIIKSALTTSCLVVSFFLFNILSSLIIGINQVIPYRLLPYEGVAMIIYITTMSAISFLIASSNYKFIKLNKVLNFFTIIIIILQLFNIINYQYQDKTKTIKNLKEIKEEIVTENNYSENTQNPDIYYIILDAYARADTLKNMYNYDNSSFINFLKEKGFYIADDARTNYNQTFLSMSSSLNLNYLNKILPTVDQESNDRAPLKKLLRNNFIYNFLKTKNYTFVSLPSPWTGLYKNTNYDIKLSTNSKQNNFNILLIKKTPLAIFSPNIQIKSIATSLNATLDQIPNISQIKKPTFSYIHILSPHPPFIFEANGDIINRNTICMEGKDGSHYFASCPGIIKYQKHYVNQLSYLNKRFESIINEILEKSEIPPIIILQGDHGPGSMLDWKSLENSNIQERMTILNAYYVPEKTKKILYPSISPVNSFRVLFNSLFNTQFEILEDKSYFELWDKPYQFIDVSESID